MIDYNPIYGTPSHFLESYENGNDEQILFMKLVLEIKNFYKMVFNGDIEIGFSVDNSKKISTIIKQISLLEEYLDVLNNIKEHNEDICDRLRSHIDNAKVEAYNIMTEQIYGIKSIFA